jgi:hypothetical protein
VEVLGEPEKKHIAETPQEPLANELKAFISAVQTGDASALTDPVHARHALQIALTALK